MDRRHLIGFLILTIGLLGCGLNRGNQVDNNTVPVSEEAASSFETKVSEAATAGDRSATLTLTEEEVTSYLQLRTQMEGIQQPAVSFEPGQIIFTGRATAGVTQDLRVVATPRVQDGIPQFDFTEATFGPLPIPGPILEIVNDQLRVVLSDRMARVERIEVGDGTITIAGQQQ